MKKSQTKEIKKTGKTGINKSESDLPKTRKWGGIVIFILAFLLYANTFSNGFVLDDFPTIYGNHLTTQGASAIPTMLKTAYWYGVDGKNDFLYRPLSMITFAMEWELFPNNPRPGHVTNVLLFALTGLLLFQLLCRVFKAYNLIFPFISTLLFVVHPLHTEVVANIKSRDEILCFLFLVLAGISIFKQLEKKSWINLATAGVCYFLALLAKESAITFMFIMPMLLFYFTNLELKKNLLYSSLFVGVAVVYLFIRGSILTSQTISGDILILDNTLAGAPDLFSRYATAMYIMGLYIKLMMFPFPLSSDYSYPQIPIVGFSNLFVLISTIFYVSVFIYAILRIPKKDIISFSFLFFLIQMVLVSNIFFLTRSTMAERFLYTPLLGFCIAITWLLIKLFKVPEKPQGYFGFASLIGNNRSLMLLIALIMIPFGVKTMDRNKDWKSDVILYSEDIKHAPNSSRLHFMYANELYQKVNAGKVPENKNAEYLETAMSELKESHRLHPHYFETNYLMGIIYGIYKDSPHALECYLLGVEDHPADVRVLNNLALTYKDLGQNEKASVMMKKLIELFPDDERGYVGLAAIYFAEQKYQEAIDLLKKYTVINPRSTKAVENIGDCYGMLKNFDTAIVWFQKAASLDPGNPEFYSRLGFTYQYKGDTLNANKNFAKQKELENRR